MPSPIGSYTQLSGEQLNRVKQQATELEGVFLNTLVKEMFSGIKTDGPFGGGFAEETWRGLQSEQMATAMAKSGGIGLADQIVRDLMLRQQAVDLPPTSLPAGAYGK